MVASRKGKTMPPEAGAPSPMRHSALPTGGGGAAADTADPAMIQDRFTAMLAGEDAGFAELVRPNRLGRPTAEWAMRIHRNNVLGALRGALAGLYPALLALVGEEAFTELVRAFAAAHPPRDGRLTHYGTEMADFLRDWPAAREMPWLADVAALEEAGFAVFRTVDEPPLDPHTLAGLAEDEAAALRFDFGPHVRLVASSWPVLSLYRFALGRLVLSDSQAQRLLEREGERVLVVRIDDESRFVALEPAVHAFLRSLADGAMLADAISAGLASSGDFSPQLALKFAFDHGIFARCHRRQEAGVPTTSEEGNKT
ncbi:MAG: DUF2063 domain-containing protein [Alphaproteobacteria bacterium]|nr:MAG: DUF2063 domain-containing protein [Alphaproteobacteria bacterium]